MPQRFVVIPLTTVRFFAEKGPAFSAAFEALRATGEQSVVIVTDEKNQIDLVFYILAGEHEGKPIPVVSSIKELERDFPNASE